MYFEIYKRHFYKEIFRVGADSGRRSRLRELCKRDRERKRPFKGEFREAFNFSPADGRKSGSIFFLRKRVALIRMGEGIESI